MSDFRDKADDFSDKLLERIKKLFNKENSGEVNASKSDQNSSDKLVKKLRELDAKYQQKTKIPTPDYNSLFPEDSGLTPKTYQPQSDDELLEQATFELQPSYQSKVNKLEESTRDKMDKLEAKKTQAELGLAEQSQSLESQLESLRQKQQSKMIKQGLFHSSINTEGQREVDRYGEAMFEKIAIDYDTLYLNLALEEEKVKKSYQTAIKEYDLKYALDLEKKLSTLTNQREKRLEEVNKYNLQIMKQEEAYQKQRQELIAKEEEKQRILQELMDKTTKASESVYGKSPEKKKEFETRYDEAFKVYSQMDSSVAIKLITENASDLKATLGEENYLKLYTSIRNK